MGVGAVFAWAWIPDVQYKRDEHGGLVLSSKTLEELGEGLRGGGGIGRGYRDKFVGPRRRRRSEGS